MNALITPGGNPACPHCQHWYGPGDIHTCPPTEGASTSETEQNADRPAFPVDLYPGCPCFACMAKDGPVWRMALCPTCGNKRCPAVADHTRWACTGSNELDQTPVPRSQS